MQLLLILHSQIKIIYFVFTHIHISLIFGNVKYIFISLLLTLISLQKTHMKEQICQ